MLVSQVPWKVLFGEQFCRDTATKDGQGVTPGGQPETGLTISGIEPLDVRHDP